MVVSKESLEKKTSAKRVGAKTTDHPTLEKVVQENVRHIEENTQEIRSNSNMIHLLYGVIILLLLIIAGLAFYVGSKMGGNTTPGMTQAKDIEVTILDDARCKTCQTDTLMTEIQKLPFLAGATFTKKDFSEKGIADLMKENNITVLPAVIFNTNALNDGGQITPYLTALASGKGYSLALPSTFDPFAKRSENGFLVLEGDILKNIKESAYVEGNPEAQITWIEYSDLECPYCIKLHNSPTIDEIKVKYGNNINRVFQHFPLDFHKNALPAAEVAECLGEQKGSEAFYTLISTSYTNENSTTSFLIDEAVKLGAEKTSLETCVTENKYKDKITTQQTTGQSTFAITGTPGNVLINNTTGEYEVISGAYPTESFTSIIDKMLIQ